MKLNQNTILIRNKYLFVCCVSLFLKYIKILASCTRKLTFRKGSVHKGQNEFHFPDSVMLVRAMSVYGVCTFFEHIMKTSCIWVQHTTKMHTQAYYYHIRGGPK